jgi:hypothetical protein
MKVISSVTKVTNCKAFFNTMDWWGICSTGPLPMPHHWRKKWPIAPKPAGP